jgi:putative membrane protein
VTGPQPEPPIAPKAPAEAAPDPVSDPVSDPESDPASVKGSTGLSGNRARDHLANERTYLAWLRTAIGVLALAAAIARFGTSPGTREKIAVGITGLLGLTMLGIGTRRYYQVARDLERGRFEISRRTPLVVAALVLVAALTVLPLLL